MSLDAFGSWTIGSRELALLRSPLCPTTIRTRPSASSWAASPTGRPSSTRTTCSWSSASRTSAGSYPRTGRRVKWPSTREPPKIAGLKVIIAGAGGAAHLPGMVAAQTIVPVLGVPVESHALKGMDSLLSIVQMPGGVPVGTLAIGKAGARNAGLLAVAILATSDAGLATRLRAFRAEQTERVKQDTLE